MGGEGGDRGRMSCGLRKEGGSGVHLMKTGDDRREGG